MSKFNKLFNEAVENAAPKTQQDTMFLQAVNEFEDAIENMLQSQSEDSRAAVAPLLKKRQEAKAALIEYVETMLIIADKEGYNKGVEDGIEKQKNRVDENDR